MVCGCTAPPPAPRERDTLASRLDEILAKRGLGPDALFVIDNILRHEAPPPRGAPPAVRRVLAEPLKAADPAALFAETIPVTLQHMAREGLPAEAGGDVDLMDLLTPYLDELAAVQRMLNQASPRKPLDAGAVIADLARGPLTAHRLCLIEDALDKDVLDRAVGQFLEATARFATKLRALNTRLRTPAGPLRFNSAVGLVSLGTSGDDVHGPDAAVIVDPGGNDTYERAPTLDGGLSLIVDLGGDDVYRGSDIVVRGLAAIIDLSGNDRYITAGPGWGAAIAGVSLLLDVAGHDVYESGLIGQGAAAFGFGALMDLEGDDTYTLRAGGQGFGMAGGVGLLWDRGGNDRYRVSGLDDAYGRGGGVSNAQGAAFGFRTSIGAGVGILRDDQGDDRYEAQMFAQGMGFYYGIGMLWDRGGNDIYHAVRYAQGNGVHEAVGILRDEAGNDEYVLSVGVGQGMGLDLAVGVLLDDAGNDSYRGPVLVQGSGTANGIGMLFDGGGMDRWESGAGPPTSWGAAKWSRGLPTLGLLLYEPARATFVRNGETVAPPTHSREWGGPDGHAPVEHEAGGGAACPGTDGTTTDEPMSFADALSATAPAFGGGGVNAAAYAAAQRYVREQLAAGVSGLPRDSFTVSWALGETIRCTLSKADERERAAVLGEMRKVLSAESGTPFATAFIPALFGTPGPASLMQPIIESLNRHPSCGVRSAALALAFRAAESDEARAALVPLAHQALRSTCWRLQATARARLIKSGASPDATVRLPSFLQIR